MRERESAYRERRQPLIVSWCSLNVHATHNDTRPKVRLHSQRGSSEEIRVLPRPSSTPHVTQLPPPEYGAFQLRKTHMHKLGALFISITYRDPELPRRFRRAPTQRVIDGRGIPRWKQGEREKLVSVCPGYQNPRGPAAANSPTPTSVLVTSLYITGSCTL